MATTRLEPGRQARFRLLSWHSTGQPGWATCQQNMRVPAISFSAFMAVLIMALAGWALPGYSRLILIVPTLLGTGWAILKLRRERTVGK